MNYHFTVDIPSIKGLKCRAFTLKEYLRIAAAKRQGEKFKSIVVEILNDCAGVDILSLPKSEAEYLLFQVWCNSIGEVNHEAEYICSCGEEFFVPINFNHIQIDKHPSIIKSYDGFKLKFANATIFDDSDIITTFLKSIEWIIVGDDQIKMSDLTDQEIADMQSVIKYDEVVEIGNSLVSPTIRLGVPVKCPKCGEYHVKEFNGINSFLELVK